MRRGRGGEAKRRCEAGSRCAGATQRARQHGLFWTSERARRGAGSPSSSRRGGADESGGRLVSTRASPLEGQGGVRMPWSTSVCKHSQSRSLCAPVTRRVLSLPPAPPRRPRRRPSLLLSRSDSISMESGMVAAAPSLVQQVQDQTERDCETVRPPSPRPPPALEVMTKS